MEVMLKMRIIGKRKFLLLAALTAMLLLNACASGTPKEDASAVETDGSLPDNKVTSAVNFEHELDSYQPKKDRYHFYFTYKIVHPWWDAVAL